MEHTDKCLNMNMNNFQVLNNQKLDPNTFKVTIQAHLSYALDSKQI